MVHTADGNWIWWRALSNGWTAMVVDLSNFSAAHGTEYYISASAGRGSFAGGKTVTQPRPVKEFATAKYAAVMLALSQRPYLDHSYDISSQPKEE
jgi:hypothetical protein